MQGEYKMVYGYARVSTREQNEERQLVAMNDFGVDKIFTDKQSGKNFDRPQYKKLIKKLKPDDILVIKSIDRLGRNYEEILEQWRFITKEKNAAIVVLDMPLLDTRKSKDLTGILIADIVAQTEREFIHQRQKEGIAAAKARGVKFGRSPIPRPENYDEVYAMWRAGRISGRKAANMLNISHYTFYNWTKNNEIG